MPWPYFIVFVFYFVTAVVSNSAPIAATECLLQSEGEFTGVALNQLQVFSINVEDFFSVALICLVLCPFLLVIPFNLLYWILPPVFESALVWSPLRVTVCCCSAPPRRTFTGTVDPSKVHKLVARQEAVMIICPVLSLL